MSIQEWSSVLFHIESTLDTKQKIGRLLKLCRGEEPLLANPVLDQEGIQPP